MSSAALFQNKYLPLNRMLVQKADSESGANINRHLEINFEMMEGNGGLSTIRKHTISGACRSVGLSILSNNVLVCNKNAQKTVKDTTFG
jgi:hypothetical protein